ncbi:NAD-dependent epimerase/dehydratase family protein [Rheinheimera baltica]|uniref:NAD-dependent epimerase/dehydratase family protein n=1 Tax=Rheinheimera baltica TaxID=67576 RepID=UPI00273FA322|nr:NAD-dependent epimerase/dehydratase family protein [Rheinheimera baltica]MDP5191394.1 NAD-dependent epimerase/dehydratase family protein [Rheinheimera baltica]
MKVVIVGYGWLGQQIAAKLAANGHQLYVTRRAHDALTHLPEQLTGVVLDLNQPLSLNGHLADVFADALVICAVPPGRQHKDNQYVSALQNLALLMDNARSIGVVHLSSTGIYQGLAGEVDETCEVNLALPQVRLLAEGERALFKQPVCITLRLSGLMGLDRHPGRFVAGKTLSEPNAAVNMVHANDVILALEHILGSDKMASGVFNLCSPLMVTRQRFYQQATSLLNTQVSFIADSGIRRRVLADRFINQYNFDFKFKSAIDALVHCS